MRVSPHLYRRFSLSIDHYPLWLVNLDGIPDPRRNPRKAVMVATRDIVMMRAGGYRLEAA